jgi:tetratricopeptide (TPR) repeat protein
MRSAQEAELTPQGIPEPGNEPPRREHDSGGSPEQGSHPGAEGEPDDGRVGAARAAAQTLGNIVGERYVLLRVIGAGSMGTVFEADDQLIGRRVALKLLDRTYVRPQDAGRRFRREAHAAASIQHPNVVVVHDFKSRRDGTYYIVQELLTGSSLRQHLVDQQRLPAPEALEIMVPIMGAVIAAHRKGVIHRDIKPENIFLAEAPLGGVIPKLIDFGIALAPDTLTLRATTDRRGIIGTLAYMSPEQIRDATIDERTDVWATGVVLYELLSGNTPFRVQTIMELMSRLHGGEPAPRITMEVDVPSELADILERALAPEHDARYAKMEAFLRDILTFAQRHVPGLRARHAASIPRYVESLPPPYSPDDGGAEIMLADVRRRAADAARERELIERRRAPAPSGRYARGQGRRGLAPIESEIEPPSPAVDLDLARRAEEDLRINALEEALEHAGQALSGQPETGSLFGRMRLVQAAAGRWLGRFAEAERWSRDALANLPWRSAAWYAAFGHQALVCGYLCHHDHLPALADELVRAEGRGTDSVAHLKAASRLVVSLARAGRLDLAQDIFERAQGIAALISLEEPDVLGWLDVANAELEIHEGNITTCLQLRELAVEAFASAGMVRNACLQRCNVGNTYMHFGLYHQAEQVTRAAVLVGEPMRLNFIAPARVNLGLALARLGDLDQALTIETAALEQCARHGNRRFEAYARIYRAEILRLAGDLGSAEEEAARAVRAGDAAPGPRAYAFGMLGDVLLARGRATEALAAANEAMGILGGLDGLEEGEFLIRVVHVLALKATGATDRAGAHARVARQRLLDQADKITEPAWRQSFLENVPENARTYHLVERG